MIINIRGTSGSGKTTVVRRVMGHYSQNEEVIDVIEGRTRVVGHVLGSPAKKTQLFLLGKYSTTCGGCDTLSWSKVADYITNKVLDNLDKDVILEGLMVSSWAADRLLALQKAHGMVMIQLTTSLEDCLTAVRARRDERAKRSGKELPPLNPHNTTTKWQGVKTGGERIKRLGGNIEFHDREAAYRRCCELLELPCT